METQGSNSAKAIILFDGVCNLCNGAVNFIIDRDPQANFRFASLQSAEGQALLKKYELPQEGFKSLVLVRGDKVYQKSSAALRIARKLTFPWPLAFGFWLVPKFLRDGVYSLVAHNRYRWFGRQDSCRMPEPHLKARFL